MIKKRIFGKTYVSVTSPWGLNRPYGHRLLCGDGVIRAAWIAQCPDTFFSTPARIRYKGRSVTGYMTSAGKDDLSTGDAAALVFHPHTGQPDSDALAWPCYDNTPGEDVAARYDRMRERFNAVLAKGA